METSDTLIQRLRQHAAQSPDHPAVVSGSLTLSYAELYDRVTDCARGLRAAGLDTRACVAIKMEAPVAHLVHCLALAHLGVSACALPGGHAAEQGRLLDASAGVTHWLGEDGRLQRVRQAGTTVAEPPAAPGDARLLFATSGTTGRPKIVVLDSRDLVDQAPRHVTGRDRFACRASLAHSFVKRHRLYCVAQGATNVFLDPEDAALPQCSALGVNVLHLTAFQARELLGEAGSPRLDGVRLKLGGSPVPPALRRQLRQQLTPDLHCGYGTTETGAIAFSNPHDLDADTDTSVGLPLPGIELKLLKPDGTPADVGEIGEITLRCRGLFRGYLGQPALSAERLREGWFHSGDLGRVDARGRLSVCGRADDLFVFNSMNIVPQDIEATICQHPAVADAAVVPRASPVHGQIPVALVQWVDGCAADLPSLQQFVRERAGVRCPRQYLAVARIPRNAAGKILRAEAAALFPPPPL
jgi:acyl-coenzyme A synthetase/AMP-(fatty) acid ligase